MRRHVTQEMLDIVQPTHIMDEQGGNNVDDRL